MRADFDGARPAGGGVVSWCGVKRRVRDTPPPFRSGDRRMSGSCQHGSRGQSKLPSAASAQESSRDSDADAADPRHAPVSNGGRLLLHPTSEQVGSPVAAVSASAAAPRPTSTWSAFQRDGNWLGVGWALRGLLAPSLRTRPRFRFPPAAGYSHGVPVPSTHPSSVAFVPSASPPSVEASRVAAGASSNRASRPRSST
jgi:hypothetical protein